MEIERKYLLKQLPSNLDSYASKKIAQGYLCTSPVVRVRRSNDSYYMTYKGAGLMVREEYNLPLTKEAYDHLVQKIDGRLIEKTRYLIPLDGGLTAELDVFEGDLAPLTLVEVNSTLSTQQMNSQRLTGLARMSLNPANITTAI